MLVIQKARSAVAVAFLFATTGACAADAKQYKPLISTPLPALDANAPALDARKVRLDARIVPDKRDASAASVEQAVYLELFHDAKFKTSLKQSCSADGCSLSGTIDDQPGSTVILLRKSSNSLVGNVRDANGRTFQISPVRTAAGKVSSNGQHVIQRLKPQVFPDERSPAAPRTESAPARSDWDLGGNELTKRSKEGPADAGQANGMEVESRLSSVPSRSPAGAQSPVESQPSEDSVAKPTVLEAPVRTADGASGELDSPAESDASDKSVIPHAVDEVARLNVLVLYTANARKTIENQGVLAGRAKSIEDEIRLAAEATNQSFANSTIQITLNIVAIQETAYTEATVGDPFSEALWSMSEGIGVFNDIFELKTRHNAHLVSLWISEGTAVTQPSSCGLAYLLNAPSRSFGRYAFSVVHGLCGLTNFSFAHEIGHNLGAQHNREVEGSPPDSEYNFGYIVPSRKFRCVMSYNCPTVSDAEPCVRQPIWSNPAKRWLGELIGVAAGASGAADNARELNQNRFVAADFWQRSFVPTASSVSADEAPPRITSDKPSRRPRFVP